MIVENLLFKHSEFACKCDKDCSGKYQQINRNLVIMLQGFRIYLENLYRSKVSIRITSGIRCPEWNKTNNGKEDSDHLYGNAVDFQIWVLTSDNKYINIEPKIVIGHINNYMKINLRWIEETTKRGATHISIKKDVSL